jgi:hypothetical protein
MFLLVLLVEVKVLEVHGLSEAQVDASAVLGRLRTKNKIDVNSREKSRHVA